MSINISDIKLFCILLPVYLLFTIIFTDYAAHYKTIRREDIMTNLVRRTIYHHKAFNKNVSEFCEYKSTVNDNKLYYNIENINKIYNAHELRWGGEYYPYNCTPMFSSAIVVPYRNRPQQLELFLIYIHNYLRFQRIHYRIFIIEQVNDTPFNRGKLLNIGSQLAMQHNFPCLILHDVDMIPERLGNLYACTNMPRHMASGINKNRYNLPYLCYIGAVTSVDSETYKLVNGFSNLFEGWGGEDDDFFNRLVHSGLSICRFHIEWSQYRMLAHRQEKTNADRRKLVLTGKSRFESDGINNLVFTLINQTLSIFSTHVYVFI